MRGRIETNYDHRTGMPRVCCDALQTLRSLGWAVAVIKPEVVGSQMYRGRIELTMSMAGVNRAMELQTFNVKGQR